VFASLGVFAGLGLDSGGADGVPSTIREAIYYLLIGDPAIYEAVDDRIWPNGLPQDPSWPAITYSISASNESRKWSGKVGIRETRAQISAWSRYQSEAEALANAIREVFTDFNGQVGDVTIEDCEIANELDLSERPATATDQYLYRILLDLTLTHRDGA